MLTDSRFLIGVGVGVIGFIAFHKLVRPVSGKGQ